jgi:ribosomal protein S18 acetylase RimI-like enzyme
LIPAQSINQNVNIDSHDIIIRPAQINDLSGLAEILAYGFYDFPQLLSWVYPLLRLSIYEDLRSRLRSHPPLYCCLVATFRGVEPLGTLEIAVRSSTWWSTDMNYAYVSNLAVKNCYRRQGIGRKLLAKSEQIAQNWGYQEIRLHVLDKNLSAKQLYFCSGYQLERKESDWNGFLLNNSQRLLLTKQLSDNSDYEVGNSK